MNILKKKHSRPFIFTALYLLSFLGGCEDNTLKRPEPVNSSDGPIETSPALNKADRAYIRELAREFAHEFRKEIGSSVPSIHKNQSLDISLSEESSGLLDELGNAHPLLDHCTEAVLEFYLQHKDAFVISNIDQLPKNLQWGERFTGGGVFFTRCNKGWNLENFHV